MVLFWARFLGLSCVGSMGGRVKGCGIPWSARFSCCLRAVSFLEYLLMQEDDVGGGLKKGLARK